MPEPMSVELVQRLRTKLAFAERQRMVATPIDVEDLRSVIDQLAPATHVEPRRQARCPFVSAPEHDYPGSQCGLHDGHSGAHTTLISSDFLHGANR